MDTALLELDLAKKAQRIKHVESLSKDLLKTVEKRISINPKAETKKIIWQFWWQGENEILPEIRKWMDSVKQYETEYEVIIITKDNVRDYIKLPEFILEKVENEKMSLTHFSDIVRVFLLSKYGGIWIDATVLLTGPIPKKIKKSDLFVFQNPDGEDPTISSWFIVSNANNIIIEIVKEMLIEYWKKEDTLIEYFLIHFFFKYAIEQNEACKEEFNKVPFYSNKEPHDLQWLLMKEYNRKKIKEIYAKTPIHKLTYKAKLKKRNILRKILKPLICLVPLKNWRKKLRGK